MATRRSRSPATIVTPRGTTRFPHLRAAYWMVRRWRAAPRKTAFVPCSWYSKSTMRTRSGVRPMASQIPTSTNNIDRVYTADPVEFARAYLGYLQTVLQHIDAAEIGRFIRTLLDARERDATIFFIGNGGSAATASHFANDLSIGT